MLILTRQQWRTVTAIFIAIFLIVLFLHAIMPHEHAHEIYGEGLFAALHSVFAEKFFVFIVPMLGLFLVFKFIYYERITTHSFSRGGQVPALSLLTGLQAVFAKGILNTKLY